MRKILASSTIGLLGEQINSVLKYLDREWILEAHQIFFRSLFLTYSDGACFRLLTGYAA